MLKNDIKINSSFIWQLLTDKEILSIREIQELTNFEENIIHITLGWLAKEDKIKFTMKDNLIYIELPDTFHEKFY